MVVVLAFVLLLKTSVPLALPLVGMPMLSWALAAVPTARLPPIVMRLVVSVRIESPMAPDAVNLAILPGVPPAVVTPPPTPAQLPAVVQTK